MSNEGDLQRALLAAIPARLPWLRLYRRMVGRAEVRGRTVSFGVAGQCDLHGFTRGGRAVEIELKSATGQLSAPQKAWRDSLHGWGVVWICLKAEAGETVDQTVGRWLSILEAELQNC